VDDVRFLVHELHETKTMKASGFTDPTGNSMSMEPGTRAHRAWQRGFNSAYLSAHSQALHAEAEFLAEQVRARTRGQVDLCPEELAASDPTREREFLRYMNVDGTPLESHPKFVTWQKTNQPAHISQPTAKELGIPEASTIGDVIRAAKKSRSENGPR
jgi:hypothetical protein